MDEIFGDVRCEGVNEIGLDVHGEENGGDLCLVVRRSLSLFDLPENQMTACFSLMLFGD